MKLHLENTGLMLVLLLRGIWQVSWGKCLYLWFLSKSWFITKTLSGACHAEARVGGTALTEIKPSTWKKIIFLLEACSGACTDQPQKSTWAAWAVIYRFDSREAFRCGPADYETWQDSLAPNMTRWFCNQTVLGKTLMYLQHPVTGPSDDSSDMRVCLWHLMRCRGPRWLTDRECDSGGASSRWMVWGLWPQW